MISHSTTVFQNVQMDKVAIKVVFLLFFLNALSEGLRIGAFNIQTFGRKKVGNKDVMAYIDKVKVCYHLC